MSRILKLAETLAITLETADDLAFVVSQNTKKINSLKSAMRIFREQEMIQNNLRRLRKYTVESLKSEKVSPDDPLN